MYQNRHLIIINLIISKDYQKSKILLNFRKSEWRCLIGWCYQLDTSIDLYQLSFEIFIKINKLWYYRICNEKDDKKFLIIFFFFNC